MIKLPITVTKNGDFLSSSLWFLKDGRCVDERECCQQNSAILSGCAAIPDSWTYNLQNHVQKQSHTMSLAAIVHVPIYPLVTMV